MSKPNTPLAPPTPYSIYLDECITRINSEMRASMGLRYSQKTLAEDAGVPQPTLSRILTGESRNPVRATYGKLADAARLKLLELGLPIPDGDPDSMPVADGYVSHRHAVEDTEMSRRRMEHAMAILDDEVPGWTDLPLARRSRLVLMYYSDYGCSE